MPLDRKICEATRAAPADVDMPGPDPLHKVHLCKEAAERYKHAALRPIEWFNLAAIHGPRGVLSHSFYDADGHALRSRQVADKFLDPAGAHRVPALEEVAGDMERVLDWYVARVDGPDSPHRAAALEALRGFPPEQLLASLSARLGDPPRRMIEPPLYDVCANALGEQAAPWMRGQFATIDSEHLDALARHTAGLVPAAELIDLVLEAVDRLRWPTRADTPSYYALVQHLAAALRDRMDNDMLLELVLALAGRLPPAARVANVLPALVELRCDGALDWIAHNLRHAPAPLAADWATAAAVNGLTWPRAAAWLDAGPPLSDLALDAMADCRPFEKGAMPAVLEKVQPKIAGAPSPGAVRAKLKEHAGRNLDMGVEEQVTLILRHLRHIFPFERRGGPNWETDL
jgi:hypothetical protein